MRLRLLSQGQDIIKLDFVNGIPLQIFAFSLYNQEIHLQKFHYLTFDLGIKATLNIA